MLHERLTTSPLGRTLRRHLDEIASYAFGAYGQITRGPTIADRLAGVFLSIVSPWTAYGSNPGWEKLPGLVRDAALVTLYVRWLVLT